MYSSKIIKKYYRYSSPQNEKNYHNLLTLMSFQICMSFFSYVGHKEDILKNAGNQTVDGLH